MNETLVSGYTELDGSYNLPALIGSTIDYVKIDYHDHIFVASADGEFQAGRTIEENGYYGNNDFVDVTIDVTVDVTDDVTVDDVTVADFTVVEAI